MAATADRAVLTEHKMKLILIPSPSYLGFPMAESFHGKLSVPHTCIAEEPNLARHQSSDNCLAMSHK